MAETAVSAAVKDGVDASLRDAGRAYMMAVKFQQYGITNNVIFFITFIH